MGISNLEYGIVPITSLLRTEEDRKYAGIHSDG